MNALPTIAIPPPFNAYHEDEADRPLYVYFIQADADGPIKIGTAYNLRYRLSSLLSGTWHDLRLVGWVVGSRKTEKNLHKQFAADRIKREWFKSSDAIVSFIRENQGQRK
jgi:hypothetical protein